MRIFSGPAIAMLALLVLSLGLVGGCAAKVYQPRNEIALDRVPIRYNFGSTRTTFAIDPSQWSQVRAFFQPPPPSPRHERHAIRLAIRQIDLIAGEQTPTHRDLGRNRANPLGDGGMDCRDRSTNTTMYLTLLDQHGLLQWHDVMQTAFRGPLHLSVHHSAMVRDRISGQLYVVDPWYLDHGHLARVQTLEDWLHKRPPPEQTP